MKAITSLFAKHFGMKSMLWPIIKLYLAWKRDMRPKREKSQKNVNLYSQICWHKKSCKSWLQLPDNAIPIWLEWLAEIGQIPFEILVNDPPVVENSWKRYSEISEAFWEIATIDVILANVKRALPLLPLPGVQSMSQYQKIWLLLTHLSW